jgi:hypothetical protein
MMSLLRKASLMELLPCAGEYRPSAPGRPLGCLRDVIEVAFQGRLQKGALVRGVPIPSSDRHPAPKRDPCRGQPLFSYTEQNLNGRFENGVYACGGTRLNGRFTGL